MEVIKLLPTLKQLRKEAGISQQKLADAIGVSQQSINQYENHDVEPDISVLCRMADYFVTSIDYIVGRTQNPSPIEPPIGDARKIEEDRLLRDYRMLPPISKELVCKFIGILKETNAKESN